MQSQKLVTDAGSPEYPHLLRCPVPLTVMELKMIEGGYTEPRVSVADFPVASDFRIIRKGQRPMGILTAVIPKPGAVELEFGSPDSSEVDAMAHGQYVAVEESGGEAGPHMLTIEAGKASSWAQWEAEGSRAYWSTRTITAAGMSGALVELHWHNSAPLDFKDPEPFEVKLRPEGFNVIQMFGEHGALAKDGEGRFVLGNAVAFPFTEGFLDLVADDGSSLPGIRLVQYAPASKGVHTFTNAQRSHWGPTQTQSPFKPMRTDAYWATRAAVEADRVAEALNPSNVLYAPTGQKRGNPTGIVWLGGGPVADALHHPTSVLAWAFARARGLAGRPWVGLYAGAEPGIPQVHEGAGIPMSTPLFFSPEPEGANWGQGPSLSAWAVPEVGSIAPAPLKPLEWAPIDTQHLGLVTSAFETWWSLTGDWRAERMILSRAYSTACEQWTDGEPSKNVGAELSLIPDGQGTPIGRALGWSLRHVALAIEIEGSREDKGDVDQLVGWARTMAENVIRLATDPSSPGMGPQISRFDQGKKAQEAGGLVGAPSGFAEVNVPWSDCLIAWGIQCLRSAGFVISGAAELLRNVAIRQGNLLKPDDPAKGVPDWVLWSQVETPEPGERTRAYVPLALHAGWHGSLGLMSFQDAVDYRDTNAEAWKHEALTPLERLTSYMAGADSLLGDGWYSLTSVQNLDVIADYVGSIAKEPPGGGIKKQTV